MKHLRRIALTACVTTALFAYFDVVTTFLLWYCLDTSIADYIPTSINFLQYWKDVYNVRNCLTGTGYFGHEELLSGLNTLGLSSPGASHGLGNTLFYALLGLPVWQFDTPIYINLVLTALGLPPKCLDRVDGDGVTKSLFRVGTLRNLLCCDNFPVGHKFQGVVK